MRIAPEEIEIRGTFQVVSGKVVADAAVLRIERLVRDHLKELGRDVSGWDVLYIDPIDGRLWELTYPLSHMHGGGPPLLTHITAEQATQKYPYRSA
jgi:hypothetical protein